MSRVKLIFASFLLFVLLSLSLTAWLWIQPEEEGGEREERISNSSAYPGMSIRTWTEKEETYRSTIQIPVFRDKTINKKVRTYINKEQDGFHERRKRQKPRLLLERPAAFSVSFDIHPVGKHLYSVVLNVDSFTGTREPVRKQAFMMNLESGESVAPGEMFKERGLEHLRRLWKDDETSGEDFFHDIYLTKEKVVFLEDSGEEIEVSYHEVSDLLKDKWRSVVSIDRPENMEDKEKEYKEKVPVAKKKKIQEPQVALTFDDGPHPEYTPQILELLDEYNQTGTFFLLGSRVDFYPEVARKIRQQEHEIGNHTWTHRDLTTLSEPEIQKEVERTQKVIEEATDIRPEIYRPPNGAENQKVKQTVRLPSILWTIDTEDWKKKDAEEIKQKVRDNIEAGSVILMHDIQREAPEILEGVLEVLEEKDMESVGISEMYTYPGNE